MNIEESNIGEEITIDNIHDLTVRSSYMEKTFIKVSMEYLYKIKSLYSYCLDPRYLTFYKKGRINSIAVEKVWNLRKLHETYVDERIDHYVIYRIRLKKSVSKFGSVLTDMEYGDPYEGLFSKIYEMALITKVRIGQAINKFSDKIYTLKDRIDNYFSIAFNCNPRTRGMDQFSRDLRTIVGMDDYETNKEIIKIKKEKAKNLLKIDILHICETYLEADAAERFNIYFHKARDPNFGYNLKMGGQRLARKLPEALFIMKDIGFTFFDIDLALRECALRPKVVGSLYDYFMKEFGLNHKRDIIKLIKYWFKDPSNGKPMTLQQIVDVYRVKRIIMLMKCGFWEMSEIAEQFGFDVPRNDLGQLQGGIYGVYFNALCARVLDGMSFEDLKLEILDEIIYPIVRKKSIRGEISYDGIASLISGMTGLKLRTIMSKLYGHSVTYEGSSQYGKTWMGGLEGVQKLIKREIAIPLLMLNVLNKKILEIIGYSDSNLGNPNNLFFRFFDYNNGKLGNKWNSEIIRIFFTGRYLPGLYSNKYTIKNELQLDYIQDILNGNFAGSFDEYSRVRREGMDWNEGDLDGWLEDMWEYHEKNKKSIYDF